MLRSAARAQGSKVALSSSTRARTIPDQSLKPPPPEVLSDSALLFDPFIGGGTKMTSIFYVSGRHWNEEVCFVEKNIQYAIKKTQMITSLRSAGGFTKRDIRRHTM